MTKEKFRVEVYRAGEGEGLREIDGELVKTYFIEADNSRSAEDEAIENACEEFGGEGDAYVAEIR